MASIVIDSAKRQSLPSLARIKETHSEEEPAVPGTNNQVLDWVGNVDGHRHRGVLARANPRVILEMLELFRRRQVDELGFALRALFQALITFSVVPGFDVCNCRGRYPVNIELRHGGPRDNSVRILKRGNGKWEENKNCIAGSELVNSRT
jgi:hypothetical protein